MFSILTWLREVKHLGAVSQESADQHQACVQSCRSRVSWQTTAVSNWMISGPFFSSPSPLLSTRQTSGQKYIHRQNSKLKLCRQSRQASRKPPSNAVGTWDLTVLIQREVNKATVGTAPALPSSRCCPGIRETKVCLHCSGLLTTTWSPGNWAEIFIREHWSPSRHAPVQGAGGD